jgi:hypothetical protein
MVTPTYATFQLRNLRTGETYNIDAYIADVDNQAVRFDGSGAGAGTGSQAYYKIPADSVLEDISVVTGPTVITKLALQADQQFIPGKLCRLSIHLTTLPQRPKLSVGYKAGTLLGAVEKT